MSETISRRALLHTATALAVGTAGGVPPLKIGIMDVILGFASDPEVFATAERIGWGSHGPLLSAGWKAQAAQVGFA